MTSIVEDYQGIALRREQLREEEELARIAEQLCAKKSMVSVVTREDLVGCLVAVRFPRCEVWSRPSLLTVLPQ